MRDTGVQGVRPQPLQCGAHNWGADRREARRHGCGLQGRGYPPAPLRCSWLAEMATSVIFAKPKFGVSTVAAAILTPKNNVVEGEFNSQRQLPPLMPNDGEERR